MEKSSGDVAGENQQTPQRKGRGGRIWRLSLWEKAPFMSYNQKQEEVWNWEQSWEVHTGLDQSAVKCPRILAE